MVFLDLWVKDVTKSYEKYGTYNFTFDDRCYDRANFLLLHNTLKEIFSNKINIGHVEETFYGACRFNFWCLGGGLLIHICKS